MARVRGSPRVEPVETPGLIPIIHSNGGLAVDARSIAAPRRHMAHASAAFGRLEERAIALWPRIDRGRLARCRRDPVLMAAVIARETPLPRHTILARLLGTAVPRREVDLWFG